METIKRNFPVTGMTCSGCASNAERQLSAQQGVLSASVNLPSSSALVEYDPKKTTPEQLKQALLNIGYDLIIAEEEDANDEAALQQQKSLGQLKRKTIGSILLATPVFIIGMFFMHMPYANWIMLAFTLPILLFFGNQFFVHAWQLLKRRQSNMDTLVALSTGIAFLFSLFNTIYPEYWTARGMEAHVYYEASAVIIALVLLGRLLEDRAKSNTSSAIRRLIGLQPKTVTIIDPSGTEKNIPIKEIRQGDKIIIKPGDKIPVDGRVTEGSSFINESMITGEPIPNEKIAGDQIYAGTINQKGSFIFIAEKVGKETLLAQIIKTVQEAQSSKAPVQKLVDKIAAIFVPAVIIISLITFIIWMVAGGDQAFTHALLTAVTVLVISCPCALGLATPTAIMVGIGKGAENNILIKNAESLETMKQVDTIVLDKTGTITAGKPVVTNTAWFIDENHELLQSILYSIEKRSEHPLAEAVCQFMEKENISACPVEQFESITGHGVQATFAGQKYYIGNSRLLADKNIPQTEEQQKISLHWQEEGKTVVFFTGQQQVLAAIAISDQIKENSKKAITQLQNEGFSLYMLTGDQPVSAQAVARQVGIQHFQAEILPQGKADFVKSLQKQGHIVAMVGDGINDSQALAQADVSIAMGKGSDIAIDVAEITLITSDLTSLHKVISLSRQTVNAIRQNLFWAFIYNIIGIPLAAGILYPFNGFLLNPMIAAAAMAFSSISVVSNSLRIKWKKLF